MNFYEFLNNEQVYSCNSNQNIDYNVKIFPSDDFDGTTLSSGEVYISKLVDDINLQYNYNHTSDVDGQLDLYYTVKATTLIIQESDENSDDLSQVLPIKKSEHILKYNEKTTSGDNKNASLSDNVVIDYDTYMKEAEEFKKDVYSLSYSALLLNFEVDAVKHIDGNPDITIKTTGSVKIPLDQESFVITTKFVGSQQKNCMKYDNPQLYINYILLAVGCIILILDFMLFYLNKKFYRKYSSSGKKIEGFLFEYNEVVFVSKNKPDFANKNKILLNDISELKNLYSLIRQPIIYYKDISDENIVTNCFFVNYYDIVYVFTFKDEVSPGQPDKNPPR
jgi:hypothetical protein